MINGVFQKNRLFGRLTLSCGIFLTAFFIFIWHKDGEAAVGEMLFAIALGLFFVMIGTVLLLFNRKAFLKVDGDRIIGACGWFQKFDLSLSDVKSISVAPYSLTLTAKNGKQISIGELRNNYDIYYFVCRRISFDSEITVSERKNELRTAKLAQKKGGIILIGSIVWMFIVIAITVVLTGSRDFPDFTQSDWTAFGIMCAVFVITVIPLFYFAGKIGKPASKIDYYRYATRRSVIESAPLLPGNAAQVFTDDFYSFRLTVFGYPNSDSVYYTEERFDKDYNLVSVFESEVYESIGVLEEALEDMVDITGQVIQ